MKAAEDYQTKQETLAARLGSDVSGHADAAPTAPPTSQELSDLPSAPPMEASTQPIETFQSSECVVCLEMKVKQFCQSNAGKMVTEHFSQRTLTVGERITLRLVSSLTRLELTNDGHMILFVFSEAV